MPSAVRWQESGHMLRNILFTLSYWFCVYVCMHARVCVSAFSFRLKFLGHLVWSEIDKQIIRRFKEFFGDSHLLIQNFSFPLMFKWHLFILLIFFPTVVLCRKFSADLADGFSLCCGFNALKHLCLLSKKLTINWGKYFTDGIVLQRTLRFYILNSYMSTAYNSITL